MPWLPLGFGVQVLARSQSCRTPQGPPRVPLLMSLSGCLDNSIHDSTLLWLFWLAKEASMERRKQLNSQDGIVQDDRVKVRALGFGVVRVFGAQGEVRGYGQAVGVGMKPLQEISHSLPLTGLPMFLVALAQKICQNGLIEHELFKIIL